MNSQTDGKITIFITFPYFLLDIETSKIDTWLLSHVFLVFHILFLFITFVLDPEYYDLDTALQILGANKE